MCQKIADGSLPLYLFTPLKQSQQEEPAASHRFPKQMLCRPEFRRSAGAVLRRFTWLKHCGGKQLRAFTHVLYSAQFCCTYILCYTTFLFVGERLEKRYFFYNSATVTRYFCLTIHKGDSGISGSHTVVLMCEALSCFVKKYQVRKVSYSKVTGYTRCTFSKCSCKI